jgi:ppGpp synthetase/RelA/SpoT-type nucleotidyltranferase
MNFRDYKRSGFSLYSEYANTVANILDAAIRASQPPYRYQHIQRRAKSITSLEQKMPSRLELDPERIEDDIKDLAGCRLIFYTNSEVKRFVNSGILQTNFEIDYGRTKVHHPVPGHNKSQFRSRNVVVRMKPDRACLPEYSRFANLRCEVQVQTILNHAWAETAHDIIYHRVQLPGISDRQLKHIDQRLDKIMTEHLIPAGHEFQKVWDDYEQVVKGKELVEQGAVASLLALPDNSERREKLVTIRDQLLPILNDPESSYPPIRDQIVASMNVARATAAQQIQASRRGFGDTTLVDYLQIVVEVLGGHRYIDVAGTFDAACSLFVDANTEEERQVVITLFEQLAAHDLEAWKVVGPSIQVIVMEKLRTLPETRARQLRAANLAVLGEVLGTEAEGTSSSYGKVTWSSGSVISSPTLRDIRKEALAELKGLYCSSATRQEKRQVINVFSKATQTPRRVQCSDDLLADVIFDTAETVGFFSGIAPSEDFKILQIIEHNVLWYHRRFRGAERRNVDHEQLATSAQRLEAAIATFRALADANSAYVTYKTLVGYQSVFAPAWEDANFEINRAQEYRSQRIDELTESIGPDNADSWLETILHCASADLDDGATFVSFREFLQGLGRRRPAVALEYLARIDNRMSNFLTPLCMGIRQAGREDDLEKFLRHWVAEEQFLIPIALYLQQVTPVRLDLLRGILSAGIRQADVSTVLATVAAVLSRANENVPDIEQVIVHPAMKFFIEHDDAQWLDRAWFLRGNNAVLNTVSETTIELMLASLVNVPECDYKLEAVLQPMARRFPERVIDYLASRLQSPHGKDILGPYEPIPYKMQGLEKSLMASTKKVVSVGRHLYGSDFVRTRHGGFELVKIVFPEFPAELQAELRILLASGNSEDKEFIALLLREYDGDPKIYEFCKEFVDALPEGDELLAEIRIALTESDVVGGEFGYVNLYKSRMAVVKEWLADPRIRVRAFAAHFLHQLENSIAAEQHRADEDVAMRKLAYDDLPDEDNGEDQTDSGNEPEPAA